MWKKVIAIGLAGALTGGVLTACGDSGNEAGTAPSGPQVSFISPSEGSTLPGSFDAMVSVTGFDINASSVGTAAKDGEGHLHFSLDDGKYDFPKYSGANGELAEKLGVAGKYSPSVTNSISYMNLPAGPHTLSVSLANNDHSDSGTTAQVSFTVKTGPTASFTSPMQGATVDRTFTAKVDVADFMLNGESVGMTAKDGEGHLHFSLDDGKYDFPKYSGANGELAEKLGVAGKYSPSVTPEITYANLPPGEHTLKVFLANNDHSDTGVMGSVTFNVK